MAMELDFLIVAWFVYGFLGVIWTSNIWFALGVPFIILINIFWPAFHVGDTVENQIIFHVVFTGVLLMGWILGLVFLIVLKPKQIVNIDWTDKDNKNTPVLTFISIGVLLITTGIVLLIVDWPSLSDVQEIAIGITLVVIGGLILLISIILAYQGRKNKVMLVSVAALPLFVLLLVTPVIYEFLPLIPAVAKWRGLILIAVLIVIYIPLYWILKLIFVNILKQDETPKLKEKLEGQLKEFVIFSALIHITYILAMWIVDITTGTDTLPLVITAAVVVLVWSIILIIYGVIYKWRKRKNITYTQLPETKPPKKSTTKRL